MAGISSTARLTLLTVALALTGCDGDNLGGTATNGEVHTVEGVLTLG